MVFKPGQSGNPAGKKKGTTTLNRLAVIESWTTKGLYILAERAIKKALNDKREYAAMARWLQDHRIGKAPQSMELSGKGGGPITLKSNISHEAENKLLAEKIKQEKEKPAEASPVKP